jgi:hypothetical protein
MSSACREPSYVPEVLSGGEVEGAGASWKHRIGEKSAEKPSSRQEG